MRNDLKKQKIKKKTLQSVTIVFIFFTILIVGVWQLAGGGLVTDNLIRVADESEPRLTTKELIPEAAEVEETEFIVPKMDIPAKADLDTLELYKGINQYKQTGFIPLFIYHRKPAETNQLNSIEQINVPLLNQKDFRWAFDTYGDDSGSIIAANGCAIVSLAMVDSYFQKKAVDPGEIAHWAGLDHYVTYAGTAFTIYEAFGKERGYKVKEFYDFYEAMEEVQAGHPVVVGINPGYFSAIGHVMVIRGYQDGKVYINDPNDDAASQASLTGHDEAYMIQDGIAYWSFSN